EAHTRRQKERSASEAEACAGPCREAGCAAEAARRRRTVAPRSHADRFDQKAEGALNADVRSNTRPSRSTRRINKTPCVSRRIRSWVHTFVARRNVATNSPYGFSVRRRRAAWARHYPIPRSNQVSSSPCAAHKNCEDGAPGETMNNNNDIILATEDLTKEFAGFIAVN